jgi:hypothetical protein
METAGSLLHLKAPATCPYPVPDQSSPYHHSMARPQVADGGTASRYGKSVQIYQIRRRRRPTRGDPLT